MWSLTSDLKGLVSCRHARKQHDKPARLQGLFHTSISLVHIQHSHSFFIRIAHILGDSLYNFVKIVSFTVKSVLDRSSLKTAKKGEKSD
jgi:hypothetical protein